MRAVVATHGHCFDGLCSAVLFTRLLSSLQDRAPHRRAPRFRYHCCGYGPGQRRVEDLLDGDENAVLDYRFAPAPALGWYFDHHRTAFQEAGAREFFERERGQRHFFYDAAYSSCAKLVADVAEREFGVSTPELAPLVQWADKIDSAAFESAEAALDFSSPVMQLASVVEHHGDSELIARLVPALLRDSAESAARDPELQRRFRAIRRKRDSFRAHVQRQAQTMDRVVLVDLSEGEVESFGKFVTYALYPRAVYSVVLGRFRRGARINVGYNPWSDQKLDRDISSICVRYGGGGHPFVGGIAFSESELSRARTVAEEIAAELRS